MLVVELIIVLLAIFLGARLGGIGIGFAGGLGVLVLAAIGVACIHHQPLGQTGPGELASGGGDACRIVIRRLAAA